MDEEGKISSSTTTDVPYTLAADGDTLNPPPKIEESGDDVPPNPRCGEGIRSFCGRIVTHRHFELIIFVLIAINGVLMALDTLDVVRQNEDLYEAFQAAELIFLVLFTIELILTTLGHQGGFVAAFQESGWLTFDVVVVALSWMALPTVQVMLTFRCLRLLTRFQTIRNILLALQSVIPMLGSIVLLLAVIFYVYAVIFTDLFKSMYQDNLSSIDYFSRLDVTLFTLFQIMTGAGWPDIAREVMETYPGSWTLFVSFISITMFVVIELAVAALCKSVSKMEEMGVLFGSSCGSKDDNNTPLLVPNRLSLLEEKIDALMNETTGRGATHAVSPASAVISLPSPAARISSPTGVRRKSLIDQMSLNIHPNADPIERGSLMFSVSQESSTGTQENSWLPSSIQHACDTAVHSSVFQNLVVVLIFINSITMGLGTCDFVTENADMAKVFDTIDMVLLIIFSIEMLFQLGHHGMKNFFQSGWLVFDFFIISLSWAFPSFQVARAFRCFRLFSRLDFMREIMDALVSVVPNLVIVGMLLLLGFFVFGILFTDLFKDTYAEGLTSEDYFSSIPKTLFTLFQCMTIAGWPDIAREVMATYSWAWMPFIVWIVLSKFVVIQLIIALLCQSLSRVSSTDIESEEDQRMISRMEQKLALLANNVDAITATGKP